jgi:hypothetical protein
MWCRTGLTPSFFVFLLLLTIQPLLCTHLSPHLQLPTTRSRKHIIKCSGLKFRASLLILHWTGYRAYNLAQVNIYLFMNRDSAVGIATGYRLNDRGVGARVLVGSRIFFSTRRPDRLWGPPSLLPNEYRVLFPRG